MIDEFIDALIALGSSGRPSDSGELASTRSTRCIKVVTMLASKLDEYIEAIKLRVASMYDGAEY